MSRQWFKATLNGKRRLAGDTARAATTGEVQDLRREARALKESAPKVLTTDRDEPIVGAENGGPQPSDAMHHMDVGMREAAHGVAPCAMSSCPEEASFPVRVVGSWGAMRSARRAFRITATSMTSCRSAPCTGVR